MEACWEPAEVVVKKIAVQNNRLRTKRVTRTQELETSMGSLTEPRFESTHRKEGDEELSTTRCRWKIRYTDDRLRRKRVLDVREGEHEPCLTVEESDRSCDGNTPQAPGFQGFSSNTTQRGTSSDRFGLMRFWLEAGNT